MLRRLFTNSLKKQHRLILVGVAVVVGVILLAVHQGEVNQRAGQVFGRLDQRLYEVWARRWLEKMLVPPELASKIVLVLVDDASLEQLDLTYPLPRGIYTEVTKKLERAGARTIAFDLLFLEPSGKPDQDRLLSETLNDPKVVVGMALDFEGTHLQKHQPPPELMDPAGAEGRLGFVNSWSPESADVLVRVESEGQVYYSLMTMAYAHYTGQTPEQVVQSLKLDPIHTRFPGKQYELTLHSLNVNYAAEGMSADAPAESPDQIGTKELVNIAGTDARQAQSLKKLIPVLSLADLLKVSEDDAFPKDFIALVGVSATAGTDRTHTILGMMSGPEVQTNLLLNLFMKNPIRRIGLTGVMLLLVGLPLLVAVVCGSTSHGVGATFSLATLAAMSYGNYLAYTGANWVSGGTMLPFFAPATAIFLVQLAATVLHFQRDRKEFLDLIQQVCPVVEPDKLLAQGIKLGGEARELTILFSDLRSYTTFAEQLDAVTVLDTLNDYFGAVGHIFERRGGLVFDYQGDAQMVVFGLVPESQPNHATAACLAGAEMIVTLEAMRKVWAESGRHVPETGIGICTGPISFGFMGTTRRKQLVAIGDPTNAAARVQGKSKEYNAPVLVTETTRRLAGDGALFEELDDIFVKGKKEPLKVFAVLHGEMERKGLIELDPLVEQVINREGSNT